MLNGATFYITAFGMELSVMIERSIMQGDLRPCCEICGFVEELEGVKGSWQVFTEVGELKRAEYWLDPVPSAVAEEIIRKIRQVMGHEKALCDRCFRLTWQRFERKFCAQSVGLAE